MKMTSVDASQRSVTRHLLFLKLRNSNGWKSGDGQSASPYQISSRLVKPLRSRGDVFIFNMAAAHRLGSLCSFFDHLGKAFGGSCRFATFGRN